MSFYGFARGLCRGVIKVAFKFRVEGLENLPKEGGFVLCSNHRSYFDPIFLAVRFKRQITFMAKEELFKVKLLAPIIRKLGAFPIARGKGDMGAVDYAIQAVSDGKVMALFPEGTRSKSGEMLPFKSGVVVIASRTMSDVVPAAIIFEGKLRFRRKVTVRFGAPISCEELELDPNSRQSLRAARSKLSDAVRTLLEEGH